MKLLFDQNISHRLVHRIRDIFDQATQVKELDLENATDGEIWEFAKENDYTIVTFDSDFYDITVIKDFPPKIIWIRTGNLTTGNLEKLLRRMEGQIRDFIESKEYEKIGCLEILDRK